MYIIFMGMIVNTTYRSSAANVQTPSVAMETAVSQPEGAGTEEVGVSQEAGPPATQEADADQQGAAEPSQGQGSKGRVHVSSHFTISSIVDTLGTSCIER